MAAFLLISQTTESLPKPLDPFHCFQTHADITGQHHDIGLSFGRLAIRDFIVEIRKNMQLQVTVFRMSNNGNTCSICRRGLRFNSSPRPFPP
jgi:hypothetical protein